MYLSLYLCFSVSVSVCVREEPSVTFGVRLITLFRCPSQCSKAFDERPPSFTMYIILLISCMVEWNILYYFFSVTSKIKGTGQNLSGT